jgi:hypothetical protein
VYKTLNTNKKVHKVAKSWISKVQNLGESSSDELQWAEKKPTPKRRKQDTPGRLCGDFSKRILDRFYAGGEGKKKYPVGHCKVPAAQKQSETSCICNSALLRFTEGLVLRNVTQLETTRLSMCSFFSVRIEEYHLYSQIVSKNILRG